MNSDSKADQRFGRLPSPRCRLRFLLIAIAHLRNFHSVLRYPTMARRATGSVKNGSSNERCRGHNSYSHAPTAPPRRRILSNERFGFRRRRHKDCPDNPGIPAHFIPSTCAYLGNRFRHFSDAKLFQHAVCVPVQASNDQFMRLGERLAPLIV